MEISTLSEFSFSQLAEKYQTFIFNLEETVWPEEKLNESAIKALNRLKERGRKMFFFSNDVRQSRRVLL